LDNLTHSLVGLLAAEAVVRVREKKSARPLDGWSRSAIYVLSIVGNNLPDLDFSYARVSGKTFGYLLQHRGYTHTLPAALLFACSMFGIVSWLARRRGVALTPSDRWLLAGVALAGPLLHIAMDFGNNYGVHPFWPLDSAWFYGDSFFILEPSFWLAIIAPLAFSFRSRVIRVALWLVLAVALGALWYRPLVPRGHAIGLSLLTVGLLVAALRMRPLARLGLSLASFVLLALLFVVGSRLAKHLVRDRAAALFPGASTLDVVATPMPANPFCWSVILVDRDANRYWVRLGHAAIFPAWLDVDACPYDRGSNPTTPLLPLQSQAGAVLRFTEEYRGSVPELRGLENARCEVRALLRFARVPYYTPRAPDETRIVGDVRYDRNPDLDFSDFRLAPAQADCPTHVPPWLPPRADLLAP
jgi:inner membrane protein